MEEILQAFRWARLDEAVGIYNLLLTHNLTMNDLELYLKEGNKRIREEKAKHKVRMEERRKLWEDIAPFCPECGGFLNRPKFICKKKGPANREGWTCLWYCENGDCIYEKYTYEDAGEEMKRLTEGRKE